MFKYKSWFVFSTPAVIAEAVEKWKADKEARLAAGVGVKDPEEEEEHIYAVRDEEVSISIQPTQIIFISSDSLYLFHLFLSSLMMKRESRWREKMVRSHFSLMFLFPRRRRFVSLLIEFNSDHVSCTKRVWFRSLARRNHHPCSVIYSHVIPNLHEMQKENIWRIFTPIFFYGEHICKTPKKGEKKHRNRIPYDSCTIFQVSFFK